MEASTARKLKLFTVAAVVAAGVAVPTASSLPGGIGMRGINSIDNRNDCKYTTGSESSFGVLTINHGSFTYFCEG